MKTYSKPSLKILHILNTYGGEGSGNFGHAGIPGHLGGSVSQGTSGEKGIDKWKEESIVIEGREIPLLINPDYKKPGDSSFYYHETNENNIDSISKEGLTSRSIWFNTQKVFKAGIKEGFKAGDVFLVSIPNEWKKNGLIDISEQGVEVGDVIPVEWIKGLLKDF